MLAVSSLLVVSVGMVGCVSTSPRGLAELRSTSSPQSNMIQAAPVFKTQSQPIQPATFVETGHQPSASAPTLMTMGTSDDLFELVRNAPGIVLVDFYADWCGPCQVQSGILHELESTAAEHQASIIKVNIDQHKSLANQFQVSSLPTLMLIRDGEIIARKSGVADHQTVSTLLAN